MAGPSPTSPQTYLQLVDACDNFQLSAHSREPNAEVLVPWHLSPDPSSPAIGLLRPVIVAQLRSENANTPDDPAWEFHSWGVSFAQSVNTAGARTRVMREMCVRWRDTGLWEDVIGPRKWRGEMYPVYRNPFGAQDAPAEDAQDAEDDAPGDARNYAFMMERAACALFGVVTYGVHMTIYEDVPGGEPGAPQRSCRMWVPTRARTKQTWPGYLDNTVAGGINSGLSMFECLVKEAMEEASIEERVIRQYALAVGSVSYFFRTDAGWLQPEVEFCYDLRIPPGADPVAFQPKPLDGEVECFELLPLSEVIVRMRTGLFKRNCAVVVLDFMIRHGYIIPDTEPDYMSIITRLHGRFEYEKWSSY